jgi:hypothetical protein
MDIINNSDIPITVTYDECQSDSSSLSEAPTIKNCVEKTTALEQKGSGLNYLTYQNRKENDANSNYWILKKVTSSLGEQQFTSFKSYEELEKIYMDHYKNHHEVSLEICTAAVLPKANGGTRHIILDNLGTNKFYCHHLNLE